MYCELNEIKKKKKKKSTSDLNKLKAPCIAIIKKLMINHININFI